MASEAQLARGFRGVPKGQSIESVRADLQRQIEELRAPAALLDELLRLIDEMPEDKALGAKLRRSKAALKRCSTETESLRASLLVLAEEPGATRQNENL